MICKTCGVDSPETNFYLARGKPRGSCKPCVKADVAARWRRYMADPERHAELNRRGAEKQRKYRKTAEGKMRRSLERNSKDHGFTGAGVTPRQWVAILERFEYKCAYCGRDVGGVAESWADTLTLDHRTPPRKGGAHHPDNVVPACFRCNRKKGTMTAEEFMACVRV